MKNSSRSDHEGFMLVGYKRKQQKGGDTYHDFLHRSVLVGSHIRSVVRDVAACQQQVGSTRSSAAQEQAGQSAMFGG
jgi:hypothetical protein